jgi:hypothetical protein
VSYDTVHITPREILAKVFGKIERFKTIEEQAILSIIRP